MNASKHTTHLPLASFLLLAVGLSLTSCSLAPSYHRPDVAIPAHWSDGTPDKQVAAQTASSATTLDWSAFVVGEPLRTLVSTALAHNRDLRQAVLNIEVARAQYRIQRADRLPSIEGQASGTRQRVPGDLNSSGQSAIQESYQAGIGLTAFELDLFGRVRNLSEAALREYLATEENARGVRISLIAEVIQAYMTHESAQQRYALTRQTLETRNASLNLIEQRRKAGTATALDYQEAKGLAEQAQADLESTDRELRQSNNALALLVGVNTIEPYFSKQASSNTALVQDIAAGTPSQLLIDRPDIRAAEQQLRGRNADIGAARAAFFPRISLTGSFGSASAQLSDLFSSGQRAWSFAPQISVPIFDVGRSRANLDVAKIRKDIAIIAYENAIQTAFREVSDALAAVDTLRREERARSALAASSAQALALSEARYRAGLDDHLRYLDAQRSDFINRSSLIEVRTERQIALATLFRTLGGGWQTGQRNADNTPPRSR